MNKIMRFSISMLCALLLFPSLLNADQVVTLKPTRNYQELVSQRQVVDALIEEALVAFKSPARKSDASFTGKLPSNMEIVADRLLTAFELEPYRVDLLFSAASAKIAGGDIDGALELYRQILTIAPEDIDAHSYFAAWQHFYQNKGEYNLHMGYLETLAPHRAAKLKEVLKIISNVAIAPIRNTLSDKEAKKLIAPVAIVALGYALNPDGSMNDILIERLEIALTLSRQLPDAMIIVTGGVPKNNKTEARLMAEWLKSKGVSAERIVEDNAARSTVENALFSSYVLAAHNIKSAVIVSSGSHVHRAEALFRIACKQSGPMDITFTCVGTADKKLGEALKSTGPNLAGIYRDSLKTMGLWSFRSYPLIER